MRRVPAPRWSVTRTIPGRPEIGLEFEQTIYYRDSVYAVRS